jgi:hypothetical protein
MAFDYELTMEMTFIDPDAFKILFGFDPPTERGDMHTTTFTGQRPDKGQP